MKTRIFLKLTHGTLRVPVMIDAAQVFSYWVSPSTMQCHVMSGGGAIIPIQESSDTLTKLLQEEEINDVSTATAGV